MTEDEAEKICAKSYGLVLRVIELRGFFVVGKAKNMHTLWPCPVRGGEASKGMQCMKHFCEMNRLACVYTPGIGFWFRHDWTGPTQ